MDIPIDWLLEGEPWIEYRARVDLLGQSEEDRPVKSARAAMLIEPKIQTLLSELSQWPEVFISSHKSAGQLFHKLTFLAELGLKINDPGVEKIVARILDNQSDEGPFKLLMNVSDRFSKEVKVRRAWALCDAPLTVYALIKFGLENDSRVKNAVEHLTGLLRENGWPCAVSKELGNFRGPGRKDDPCPFANLAMLKVLSASAQLRDSHACHVGAQTLLHLWSESFTLHPYMFYMGNDFRKLKAPLIWYDLLHVLDVLTNFPWLKGDSRILEMIELLKSKADRQGCFTPESVWTAWKAWEFGQKKTPSRWLTLLAWRIVERMETASS